MRPVTSWKRASDHVRSRRPYMYEARGKFYFWNTIGFTVSEITSPRALDEIIKVMKEKGEDALRTKNIQS